MAAYSYASAIRYSLFVALQRLWYRCDPLISVFFRLLPSTLNLIILRTISKIYRVSEISTLGQFGPITGSPLDIAMFGEYLTTNTYSPKTLHFIIEYFKQSGGKGTFIDVGGHIGLMTIPVAQSGAVHCITFEPDSTNFNFLARNIVSCGVADRVTLHQLAVFERETTMDFEISDWHHGDHRIRDASIGNQAVAQRSPFREDIREVVTVHTVRLDDVVDVTRLQRPLVVKIDTQGSEVHVVKGGKNILSNADLVISEYCPYMIKRVGGDEKFLIEFVRKSFRKGFVCGSHNKSSEIILDDIDHTVEFLRNFSRRAKLDFVDVVLAK